MIGLRCFCARLNGSAGFWLSLSCLGGGVIILQLSVKTRKTRIDTFTYITHWHKSKSYHTVFNGEVAKGWIAACCCVAVFIH